MTLYLTDTVARPHLPAEVMMRGPPPPIAAVGPRPLIALPPPTHAGGLRPPSGLLTEEEFYREKQRLLSLERK